MGKFQDKVVLITGASRGLGAALAHRFAQEKATLILLASKVQGLEKIDEELDQYDTPTTLVPVDLQKTDRLAHLPEAIANKFEKLDVIIGNAAITGNLSPVTHYTTDVWQSIWDVNVSANWHLLRMLEPLLKQSSDPRAIFVTSGLAHQSLPYWGPYAASKAALEVLVKTYAAEVEKFGIKANLVDPGVMATDMFQKAMPGADLTKLPDPADAADIFLKLASSSCQETGQVFGTDGAIKNVA